MSDNVQPLDLCHGYIRRLCTFAYFLASDLKSKSEPNWNAVQDQFEKYGTVRRWLNDNPGVIDQFAAVRVEAVEFAGCGHDSWHAAMADRLVYDYKPNLMIWWGQVNYEDNLGIYHPDQFDWRSPEFVIPSADPPSRRREDVWAEISGKTHGAFCPSWFFLKDVNPYIIIPHLRCELAAVKRLASVSPSPAQPQEAVIYYHGGDAYSVDGVNSYTVNATEHNLLQHFLKSPHAADGVDLGEVVENPSQVIKRLRERFEGLFRDAVRCPVNGHGGYLIHVRPA